MATKDHGAAVRSAVAALTTAIADAQAAGYDVGPATISRILPLVTVGETARVAEIEAQAKADADAAAAAEKAEKAAAKAGAGDQAKA